jgi:hypothetical protein
MQFPEENLNELENIAVHDVLGHGGTFSGFVFNDDTKAVFIVNPRHGYVKLSMSKNRFFQIDSYPLKGLTY